jgi:SAM-dependent MidA family methyltransferase
MNPVADLIRREIAARGPLSFARFMELALYCPNLGYYEREAETVGRRGDFYTNVSVGRLFGELLAFQFAEWLAGIAAERVQIVEAGAHDGRLAEDILSWLAQWRPGLSDRLEYWLLEPSAHARARQQMTLAEFGEKVRWLNSWDKLPTSGITGVIFSNELLDAMPLHRLGWDADAKAWFEWGVDFAGECFVWRRLSNSGAEAAKLMALVDPSPHSPLRNAHFLYGLPDGFTLEVCPAALEWWQRAALALRAGRLLTFDYGLTVEELLRPERASGTMRAYYKHHLSDDLLTNVGEQDLTAHVNFSSLRHAGEVGGLRDEVFTTQAQFLTRIAEATWRSPGAFPEWSPTRRRQFQTLTHPEHLGRAFQVLVQSR